MSGKVFDTAPLLQAALRDGGYIASDVLSVSLLLAPATTRPPFFVAVSRVGKTAIS